MHEPSSKSEQAGIRICEIYASIQGEGLLTGVPSIFVRTSGCNLRCWFCDTPFSSWKPEGDYWSVDQIVQQISELPPKHVVLTGGEPMIHSPVIQLADRIRRAGYHLTIETAGTLWMEMECDLWSISPKLSGSAPGPDAGSWVSRHHERRYRPEVVRKMMKSNYQLKFVVDSVPDAEEVLAYVSQLGEYDSQRILLMPQGVDRETLDRQSQWLQPWCTEHGFGYCSRQHIYWFGNRRGT